MNQKQLTTELESLAKRAEASPDEVVRLSSAILYTLTGALKMDAGALMALYTVVISFARSQLARLSHRGN